MSDSEFSKALRFGGFLPKRVERGPAWLRCPTVTDVCSISNCVSSLPKDWLDHWLHNDVDLYDTPELARQVIDASGPYTVFAYRLSIVRFDDGRPEDWAWEMPTGSLDVPPGYRSLGFDVAGKLDYGIWGFGHSPLSCNGLASEYPVNAHCLLEDVDEAFAAAKNFSITKPEPGKYIVVEVLVEPQGVTATSAFGAP
jgi:hypothetical protein